MARPQISIKIVGMRDTIKFLSEIDKSLFTGLTVRWKRKLMNDMAGAGVKATRDAIRTQGFGSWEPLSKWTKARTGRRKVLSGMEKHVKPKLSRSGAMRAAVLFRSPGDWTLTQHHRGFTKKPTNKVIKVALKKPGLLGLKSKKEVFFKDDTETKVPARKVWPVGARLDRMVTSTTNKWVADYKRWLATKQKRKVI